MKFSLLNQLRYELSSLLYGYPNFIFSSKIKELSWEFPVFVFHTIDPPSFEAQLIFLKENNYQTLSIQEFVQMLQQKTGLRKNAVLLTADDGRSSFWRYGYPLLKKYQMRASLFINPGHTLDASTIRPNLTHVWNKKVSETELHDVDPLDETTCTWREIRDIFNSGFVDIENHTLFHKEVFVARRPNDFICSETVFVPFASPITPYLETSRACKPIVKEDYYGLPLFQAMPLLAGKPAIKVSEELREECKEYFAVHGNGGHLRKSWGKRLKKKLNQKGFLENLKRQTIPEVRDSIRKDLSLARSLIHNKVSRQAGNHLCLPYSVGSAIAIEEAKKVGFQSCFWGIKKDKKSNRVGDDYFEVVRIKNDFIWRLPGTNRKSLLSIYTKKLKRRFSSQQVF